MQANNPSSLAISIMEVVLWSNITHFCSKTLLHIVSAISKTASVPLTRVIHSAKHYCLTNGIIFRCNKPAMIAAFNHLTNPILAHLLTRYANTSLKHNSVGCKRGHIRKMPSTQLFLAIKKANRLWTIAYNPPPMHFSRAIPN